MSVECAVATGARGHRRTIVLSVIGALTVTVVLGFVLAGRRGQFDAALHTAPLSLLAAAAVLQIVALLARSEAWNICVNAAGGSVSRRLLFRAAGVGYLVSVLNGSLGMATRIASLRRVAGDARAAGPRPGGGRDPDHHRRGRARRRLLVHADRTAGGPGVGTRCIAVVLVGAHRLRAAHGSRQRRRSGLWAGLAIVRGKGREAAWSRSP